MRALSLVSGLLMSLCLAAGCGRPSGEPGAAAPPAIAVIPKGTTHSFWKAVHAGAEKAGRELGAEVIWQGPHKEDDRQMQIQVVQNFISRRVAAIVLAPLDDQALVPPVQAAVNRGIPVVIIDSGLNGDAYRSFVATDNARGGRLCAERLCTLLNGTGKVVMLRYQEGSASTARREAGFLEGMAACGTDIELISTDQYAGATIEKAFQAAQNLLNRFAEIDGIFCPNESSTQGMLRALQTAGRAGDVYFVGFDANETLLKAVRDGEIHGLALQDPFRMGYLGVITAARVLKGEPVAPRIDTGVILLTPDTIDTPAIRALLNPPPAPDA
ncbi:MAG: substrate-binding domain-containing protein [Lentisphaerae bacterium]|nr:substrate-binding domain-containing protein [Lentisphaerota bacterium]